jgi:hypothetical protein
MAKLLSRMRLYVGQGNGQSVTDLTDTFDPVGGLNTTTGPSANKGQVDVTDMENDVKAYISDLPDVGTISGALMLDPNLSTGAFQVGQDRLDTDSRLVGQIRNFRLDMVNPNTGVVLQRLSFKGEVVQFQREAGVASPYRASVEIRITASTNPAVATITRTLLP